ncbi:GNAT family N-acetyltransferase [Hyphomicrobium sp. 2TAF46]|uniref:GNAT family N-acetyltransferase n=1 Tax=Hyphomicrobium sp. 2TAF46 TaxID=3233019 RepID=UPI003F914C20
MTHMINFDWPRTMASAVAPLAPLHPSFVDGTTALCPFNDDTPKLFERWFADQELIGVMGDWEFLPLPYYDQTPEEFVRRTRRSTWLVCARENESLIPIGYTGLYVQSRHRVGILRLAIAEPKYRRQGHGLRATRMAIDWAFQSLDLFTLHLSVTAANQSAIELYRGCGFRECGRYQLSRFSRDGRSDEVLMELMRSDWPPANR